VVEIFTGPETCEKFDYMLTMKMSVESMISDGMMVWIVCRYLCVFWCEETVTRTNNCFINYFIRVRAIENFRHNMM
jgi:hypothetical protein